MFLLFGIGNTNCNCKEMWFKKDKKKKNESLIMSTLYTYYPAYIPKSIIKCSFIKQKLNDF